MLGRLRMTATDARSQYQKLGQEIFGSPRWFHYRSFPPWFNHKYDHGKLNNVIKDVVRFYDSSDDGPYGFPNASFNKTDYGVCSTIVAALGKVYDAQQIPIKKNEVNYLFRTYDIPNKKRPSDLDSGRAFKGTVWSVARACTAAPTYFIPKEIEALNGNIWRFKDAGLVLQNPTEEGVDELLRWTPHNLHNKAFNAILSIGTGLKQPRGYFGPGNPGGLLDILAVYWAGFRSANPEKVHEGMEKAFNSHDEKTYWRLNSDSEKWGQIMLDQWDRDTMTTMDKLTSEYLERTDIKCCMQECAERLVKHRRQRQLHKDEWERFALAVEYRCTAPGCFNHYNIKGDMDDHLKRCHPGNQFEPDIYIWDYTHE
ncbi:hypothetical protein BDV36DRAFT_307871 [Aspergillus pseudocaelatus]|uniref:C2H2-type domain-containing protein n=1 Tax=Aspergillus pseudocaelatus TaxID=1825620 RepID=A0ABQ6WR22_9EURO|nr:hypothetical protein BDV36DRAFT_307871 [Aspergillus pseudocaelatus]